MNKKRVIVEVGLMLVIVSITVGIVSAGFWDIFKIGKGGEDLEGELREAHEARLTIGNDPPEILDIEPPTFLILTEDNGNGTTVTTIPFTFIVYDPNSVVDLPITGIITAGYYERRPNTLYNYNDTLHTRRLFDGLDCSYVIDINATPYNKSGLARRYSCNVNMFYYDDPLLWDVRITSFQDLDGNPAMNLPYSESDVFSPAETIGFYTNESTLEFGTVRIIGFNATPAKSPVTIVNTGNTIFNGLTGPKTFDFTGNNLTGVIDPNYTISSKNFKVNTDNPLPCNNSISSIGLQDLIPSAFPAVNVNNGDLLIPTDAKTNIYFCMVTLLESPLAIQTYSTVATGEGWEISN